MKPWLVPARTRRKSWAEPPFWALDAFRTPLLSSTTSDKERIENDFEGYVQGAYKANSILFACVDRRQQVFSQARFQWRGYRNGIPGDFFGSPELSLLEHPWPNGTTGELLSHMESDATLAGNFYSTVCDDDGRVGRSATGTGRRIVRMRPDWVTLVIDAPSGNPYGLDARVVAYVFEPKVGGVGINPPEPVTLLPSEVCHYSPKPDPVARFRGMSWLTPVLEEITADKAATRHKGRFFRNGATPNMAIKFDKDTSPESFADFVEGFNSAHQGADKAYKTLFLAGGADVVPLSVDFRQLDFKVTQGAGEPLALDTPVPTPAGWTTMGEIKPGDQVVGRDGRPANVVGVSPVHTGRDCYRITLKDRTSIVADASHLWMAVDRNTDKRAERQYTTAELYELFTAPYCNGAGGHRLSLPAAPIVELDAVDLLVDPYVLGAWLGDGQTAGAAICGDREDLKFVAGEIEARGYTTTRWSTAPDKVDVIGVPGGLLAALRALGVLGAKRIPGAYLRASAGQRLDLLRGLMDTDGTVDVKGRCEFSSKDQGLARQVVELVRSLGYRATLSSKSDARSRTGETWRVFFRVAQDRIPFVIPRKVDRCLVAGDPHVTAARSIVSIEPVESVPVRCIAVDTVDHLFLAGEGFVPTHNTRIATAAGVPAVILGISEGLQGSSLNAGNFGAARRLFVDSTMRDLWNKAAASWQSLINRPATSSESTELAVDDRHIPFLREDAQDQARIVKEQMLTIESGVRAGFDPKTIVDATVSGDLRRMTHTGLYSVQLQPPGTETPTPAAPESSPNGRANGNQVGALRS